MVLLFSVILPITVNNITSIKCSVFLPFLSFKVLKKSDTYIFCTALFCLFYKGFMMAYNGCCYDGCGSINDTKWWCD